MAKLSALAILLIASIAQAKSWKAELYTKTEIAAKTSLDENKIGGLSGMFWTGDKLIAVSDDRGKFGSPRYYEFSLSLTAKKATVTPQKTAPIKGIAKYWVLDLEALQVFPNGDFLLSTEGDNNQKPRALPRIFIWNPSGQVKAELPVPEKFLPETLGQQKRGIENNRGFEGVTLSEDGQELYAMNESPIMADSENLECQTQWLRLVRFVKTGEEKFKADSEIAYPLEKKETTDAGPELFRGVSEILTLESQKILVLERGARVSSKGISYTGAIYSYDFTGLKDVSKTASLCPALTTAGKKETLINFAEVLKSEKIENFEAMTWGPSLPDGRRSLLVLSDNNFSSREKTELLVFAMKEVP